MEVWMVVAVIGVLVVDYMIVTVRQAKSEERRRKGQ